MFTAILSFIGGSVLLIFAAGCNQPPLTPTESAGKDLYEIHCYECHDENDLGLKKVPPNRLLKKTVCRPNSSLSRLWFSGFIASLQVIPVPGGEEAVRREYLGPVRRQTG